MRAIAFVRSLVIVLFAGVVAPVILLTIGQRRFGGGSPLAGVPGPSAWSIDRLRSLLAQPLTDRALTDGAIHGALVVAWLAVAVFVLTVAAEAAHMVRHGGHHLPDVRGLRWSQRGARTVAAGLVALLPLVTHGAPAVAGGGSTLLVRAAPVIRPTATSGATAVVADATSRSVPGLSPVGGSYVVRSGDSVFRIAEQLAGPDAHAVATYAERILDFNLGREMAGGERFTNPGLIDVGWVLQLPPIDADTDAPPLPGGHHIVAAGESLWSIADDELGDPTRWPELYALNAERTFDDGAALHDPSLLRPGWDLIVTTEDPLVDPPVTISVAEQPPATSTSAAVPDHDAHHADSVVGEMPAPTPVALGAAAAPADSPVQRENRWVMPDVDAASDERVVGSSPGESAPQLLTMRRAAMLAGGVLTLAAVRRRRRMREARPRARFPEPAPRIESLERDLRGSVAGERMARVDLAVRAAAMPLIDGGQRLLAVLVSGDGTVELVASGPVTLPLPWCGAGERWTLGASVALEVLAVDARRVNAPSPAIVQVGVDELGRDVLVDLESLGALEIGGTPQQRDAIVAAIAATLAGSVLAEATTLVSVGVAADAFLGHRLHVEATDVQSAIVEACAAVGVAATMQQPIVELRARGTGGESWDPAVVLVGSDQDTVRLASVPPGVAIVSASPIEGPSSTLYPDGDAWLLRPLGVRMTPIGLVPDDVSAISELVDPDCTIYAEEEAGDEVDRSAQQETPEVEWELQVRLYGPVTVVDRSGRAAAFERSKTTELIAWLATHRERSTRANARAALWQQEVRDATFANVVSEARRTLARLVPPPDGEEWVGRTSTEALPLHPCVMTDADVLGRALAAARGQTPARAIALLREPVAAIAGMPFEGSSYLWPDSEGIAANLILLATSAAAELAAQCLVVGDIDGVFDATATGLRVLPGHEELIGLRMRAHARAGDHAAVRQEWNSYERVVNADPWSDGEPSPELVDLRKELLHPGV